MNVTPYTQAQGQCEYMDDKESSKRAHLLDVDRELRKRLVDEALLVVGDLAERLDRCDALRLLRRKTRRQHGLDDKMPRMRDAG